MSGGGGGGGGGGGTVNNGPRGDNFWEGRGTIFTITPD